MRGSRIHGLCGALGIALVAMALFLPGRPPRASDPVAALTRDLLDGRRAFVGGMLLVAAGMMAWLWFLGVLGDILREHDRSSPPFSHTAVAGGTAGIVMLGAGTSLFGGVAFRAVSMGDPALVRTVVDTGNMLIELSKFGFAVLILAICGAATRLEMVPRRRRAAGIASAVALVGSSVPPFLVTSGVGQFGGPIDVLGAIPAFSWICALSIAIAREPGMPLIVRAR